MNEYIRARYGDPCRGCGYEWSLDEDACRQIVLGAPSRFAALLAGCDGRKRSPELEWNIAAYVAHVADNTRIWAERVAAVALGASGSVAPYDEAALGAARGYEDLEIEGTLWSLDRAVEDWREAERLAAIRDVVLDHPQQGRLGLLDVFRVTAHEVEHHELDVERILAL